MYTYQTTTDSVHIFTDTDGNSYKVGIEVGSWQEALELLENPPAPPLRPHWKPSEDSPYRFGIERTDRDSFVAHSVLIDKAKSKGFMTDESDTHFLDADGVTIHTVKVGDYELMLLGYGVYMQSLAFN